MSKASIEIAKLVSQRLAERKPKGRTTESLRLSVVAGLRAKSAKAGEYFDLNNIPLAKPKESLTKEDRERIANRVKEIEDKIADIESRRSIPITDSIEEGKSNGSIDHFPAEQRATAKFSKPGIIPYGLVWTGQDLISKAEHAKRMQSLKDNLRVD